MKCPKCKSTDVSVQMMETGSTTKNGVSAGGKAYNAFRGLMAVSSLGATNLIMPKAKAKDRTKTKMEKIAVCQSCGHSWTVK